MSFNHVTHEATLPISPSDALLHSVHWSVTVRVSTESDLHLFRSQGRFSEFVIRVKTTETPVFHFHTVKGGNTKEGWWRTTSTTAEMNVLRFSAVGPLHDFSPVAVRTDRICSDVGHEGNIHKCACFDTAAAKNRCEKGVKWKMKWLKILVEIF